MTDHARCKPDIFEERRMNQPEPIVMLDTAKLATVTTLYKGSHEPDGKMCVMEAVAYVTGEPWSDHPACACPALTDYAIGLNDRMPDGLRTELLLPLVPLLAGTKADAATENQRREFIVRYTARVIVPMAFKAVKMDEWADKLAALPEDAPLGTVRKLCLKARDAALATVATVDDAYAAFAAADTAYVDDDADTAHAAFAVDDTAHAAFAATAAAHAATYTAGDAVWAAAVKGLEQACKIGGSSHGHPI